MFDLRLNTSTAAVSGGRRLNYSTSELCSTASGAASEYGYGVGPDCVGGNRRGSWGPTGPQMRQRRSTALVLLRRGAAFQLLSASVGNRRGFWGQMGPRRRRRRSAASVFVEGAAAWGRGRRFQLLCCGYGRWAVGAFSVLLACVPPSSWRYSAGGGGYLRIGHEDFEQSRGGVRLLLAHVASA